MDWRSWMYERVVATNVVPETRVFGAGGLNFVPSVWPFVVISFMGRTSTAAPGTSYQEARVWVHDKPGDFLNIDNALKTLREAIEGPVAEEGAIAAIWLNDSNDLSDDGYGTITRYTTFRLVGSEA